MSSFDKDEQYVSDNGTENCTSGIADEGDGYENTVSKSDIPSDMTQCETNSDLETRFEQSCSVKEDNKKTQLGVASSYDDKSVSNNDDLSDDNKKIFVGGLSWETTEKDLRDYFSSFGPVRACTIKLDRFSGHSRGFGFVIFEQEEAVNKTLEVKEHKLCNKRIDPKRARPGREQQKKIFVGGLDPDVTELQIREYFGKFGKIESLDLPFDSQRCKRKAYIFVSFASELEAKRATAIENQTIYGRRCDVRLAVPRDQVRQRGWYNLQSTSPGPAGCTNYNLWPASYTGYSTPATGSTSAALPSFYAAAYDYSGYPYYYPYLHPYYTHQAAGYEVDASFYHHHPQQHALFSSAGGTGAAGNDSLLVGSGSTRGRAIGGGGLGSKGRSLTRFSGPGVAQNTAAAASASGVSSYGQQQQ